MEIIVYFTVKCGVCGHTQKVKKQSIEQCEECKKGWLKSQVFNLLK